MTDVRLATAQGRWLLAAMILGSGMVFLDGSVATLALPAIDADLEPVRGPAVDRQRLHADAGRLILVGGSLGDQWGGGGSTVVGVVWFVVASVLCALAPEHRGAGRRPRPCRVSGGAAADPGSLAIISASIHREDRDAAIGRGRGWPASRRRSARWSAAIWSTRSAGARSSGSTFRWQSSSSG